MTLIHTAQSHTLALGILLRLAQSPPTPPKMAAFSPLLRGSAWGIAIASLNIFHTIYDS